MKNNFWTDECSAFFTVEMYGWPSKDLSKKSLVLGWKMFAKAEKHSLIHKNPRLRRKNTRLRRKTTS